MQVILQKGVISKPYITEYEDQKLSKNKVKVVW